MVLSPLDPTWGFFIPALPRLPPLLSLRGSPPRSPERGRASVNECRGQEERAARARAHPRISKPEYKEPLKYLERKHSLTNRGT